MRQTDGGATLTVFGTLYEGIDVDVTPSLGPRDAERIVERRGGFLFGSEAGPELVVLPREDQCSIKMTLSGTGVILIEHCSAPGGITAQSRSRSGGTGVILIEQCSAPGGNTAQSRSAPAEEAWVPIKTGPRGIGAARGQAS